MEILLASVVASAVIFFGALISIGNDRQRKAIDDLREQLVFWGLQDLRIKRGKLAREIRMDNPLGWLNKVMTKVSGLNFDLQVSEAFSQPSALLCVSSNKNIKVIFSPHSPHELQRLKREHRHKLSGLAINNPILFLPRKMMTYQISALNIDMFFELELPMAWKMLTNQNTDQLEQIWAYIY